MFDHPDMETYKIEDVPKDRDLYLMDEIWMADYERFLLEMFTGQGRPEHPGYISYAAVKEASSSGLEISWYPNLMDRFHEVRIFIPAAEFVTCIGCWRYDENPHIFVKSGWLTALHLRTNSVFCLIDAIGVKAAIKAGSLKAEQMEALSARIDEIAARYTDIAFVSFADSLLLKTNWIVGTRDTPTSNAYEPERILRVIPEIAEVYMSILGMKVYSVITQGQNNLYPNSLLHISSSANHISLNSLGLPFVQLLEIDSAARTNFKRNAHEPSELYMDEGFFHSLKWKFDFENSKEPKFPYVAPMASQPFNYIPTSISRVLNHLKEQP